MVRDPRIRARDMGDQEWLYREEKRRDSWRWENALRKQNFIGLTGEILKGVVRSKLKDNEKDYYEWIEEAKINKKARIQDRIKLDKTKLEYLEGKAE